ncbi:MAG: hypothetical protein ACPGN3_15370 [Opitutales bacterium]
MAHRYSAEAGGFATLAQNVREFYSNCLNLHSDCARAGADDVAALDIFIEARPFESASVSFPKRRDLPEVELFN